MRARRSPRPPPAPGGGEGRVLGSVSHSSRSLFDHLFASYATSPGGGVILCGPPPRAARRSALRRVKVEAGFQPRANARLWGDYHAKMRPARITPPFLASPTRAVSLVTTATKCHGNQRREIQFITGGFSLNLLVEILRLHQKRFISPWGMIRYAFAIENAYLL